jgi:hypothetical protein
MTRFVGDDSDNVFRISSADGHSSVSGGLGYDTIILDWSDRLGRLSFAENFTRREGSVDFVAYNQEITGSGIEHLSGLLSAYQDSVSMGLRGTISLDGGSQGIYESDYLDADFSDATNNITFVFNGAVFGRHSGAKVLVSRTSRK